MENDEKSIVKSLRNPGTSATITGQDIMELERFAEDIRHMIVFDVLTWDCPVGDKGQRIRIFLSDAGYQNALRTQSRGETKIRTHARVSKGYLFYDRPEHAL